MKKFFGYVTLLVMLFGASVMAFGQATTGAIQGTIKDASGAVIPGAMVTATTPTLVGTETVVSNSRGYYHIQNLPPGTYKLSAKAKGFTTVVRDGLVLEVGHLPTVDLTLAVGSAATVVNVTSSAPAIDVTTVTTQTNITQAEINYVPRGRSFQSVIQFAPGASEEPLMGNSMTGAGGTGAGSPGSQSNGQDFGYSIAGGSDSENSYLVEGQETANLIGGYSHTSVPFDFVKEVTVVTSGVPAEYGGALGGVVNVIMEKGTAHFHGSVFAIFENQALDAGPSGVWQYNPLSKDTPLMAGSTEVADLDQAAEYYQPEKSHFSIVQPGFTLGGPLLPFWSKMRDRIFFFVGFNPELDRNENFINYNQPNSGNPGLGVVPISNNSNTYYTNARIDAQVTKKVRVFGSWLYQLTRLNGESGPTFADSTNGYVNTATNSTPAVFAHTQGFDAPNLTLNTGADIAITSNLVSTTRFGYYFENYHDYGYPTATPTYLFETSGVGQTKFNRTALDPSLNQAQGFQSQGATLETFFNSNKAIQLDQDLSWYKSGWAGTHNIKFGYQLNRRSNNLSEAYNAPLIDVYPGGSQVYTTQTTIGPTNCAAISAADGTPTKTPSAGVATCFGQQGWFQDFDYGAGGSAISYDHGLFIQDAWNIGHGITLNLGIRDDKEYLPGEVEGPGVPPNPINFGWGKKIAPRLGAAWDVFRNGKMKVFGSYGVFNDTMKLNLAISSFGGEYWNECNYANNSGALSSIDAQYNAAKRACPGLSDTSQILWAGGTPPAGVQDIEAVNERAAVVTCATCNPYEEAVAPNLEPYRQHEALLGTAFHLSRDYALEVRYNRRRLDHVIEDSSIFNPAIGETFVIVNPGQGVNSTFSGFCNFLYSTGPNNCTSPGANPPNGTIPAARSYDGLEVRLNKAMSNHWFGMLSYTYSHFRGNYTGLTSSDQSDDAEGFSGGGRDAPNNSRAFDEPYFSWDANGKSSSGLLPTDRPNKLKFDGYYQIKYLHRFTTNLGVFDYIYQGSPNTSFIQDVGDPAGYDYPVQVFNRGKWANVSQNQSTGAVTVGNVHTYRTPVYAETDFHLEETVKVVGSQAFSFAATFTNLFNEHAVTADYGQIDSASSYLNQSQVFAINGLTVGGGVPWYAAAMSPYNVPGLLQANPDSVGSTAPTAANPSEPTYNAPQSISNLYGKPFHYQDPRTIRLAVHYTF